MRKLILSFIISTTLLSAEITKDNLHKYVYVNKNNTEFKIVRGYRGFYDIKKLPNEGDVCRSRDIDAILSYINKNGFKIIRECGKLNVEEVKNEEKKNGGIYREN